MGLGPAVWLSGHSPATRLICYPHLLLVFHIWCLAGTAELVGASEGLRGQVLAGLQLVAEVQLELYPEKN